MGLCPGSGQPTGSAWFTRCPVCWRIVDRKPESGDRRDVVDHERAG